ncbi:uncharacterized protein LOC116343110 isoform X2 [Contarinia nasturtii]|uniref:uncharacterized protein LOC116343110 isoform X2 n=1 Tax=Contarinia nasturtii TaxID=265458 RepID=UPI0012D3C15B|nr:uncharacterized protein LOC116343110 isoform X2 [Contarinia nasturtii]
MHAKKPQTRLAGGSLAKSLKPKVKKPTAKPNTTNKQRSIPSSIKSASSKKLTVKKSTNNSKAKDDCESTDKKSKSLNKTENSTINKASSSMGLSASKEKATTNRKQKPERKSNKPAINGEKKPTATSTTTTATVATATAATKDDKIIRSSKELKNLDIQLSGYSNVTVARDSTGSDSDTDKVIKASICENVKTKARAASATFNSSGNRSPSVNSPGPNHSKQSQNTDKSIKIETPALKSAENKSDNKTSKKKETAAKSKAPTTKAKSIKSTQDEEKTKKNTNECKKTDGDKNSNKSQKPKAKAVNDTVCSKVNVDAPAILTEKRIEIKTQVDESKSLIDTIADAINEVVKQYKDSKDKGNDATGSHSHSNNSGTSIKAAKKENKISKTSKKKVLNEKKLDVIESASDLVKDSKDAIKTISKNAKAKQKLTKDNKIDDKICDQNKQSSEKIKMEKEAAVTEMKASNATVASETEKKSNDKANKSASKGKAKPKVGKKSTANNAEQTEAKGSKIIKIDLKAKKKVKPLATTKSVSLKLTAKKQQHKTTTATTTATVKDPKLCQDDKKKNDEHKSQAKPDEISDDDNLSLTELKAQLSKNDAQKTDANAKSSNTSTKLVNAGSNSTNKSTTKSRFKKPSVSSAETTVTASATATPKKRSTNQKETGTVPSSTNKSDDVYEFHDANFSGDDVPYVHKKKREKISSIATMTNQESTTRKDDNLKKSAEKSKTLPLKKQIRHDVIKEASKTATATSSTKTDSKSTTATNVKGNNRSASNSKTEQGENDNDSKISDTKKSTKAHANNGHKLAAKNRRLKLFGFYSGPKRHRMASLNALAKVQCLYENESRTAQELGFVKEPQNVQRMKFVSDAGDKSEPPTISTKNHGKEKEVSASEPEKKEKKAKKDGGGGDDVNIELERHDVAVNNRTLRKMPGRGEGTLWEMENSSMDESDTEKEIHKMSKPMKTKIRKKILSKKPIASTKKAAGKDESNKVANKKLKTTPSKVKAKSSPFKTKSSVGDTDTSSDSDTDDHDSKTIDRKPKLKKLKKAIAKAAVAKSTDIKEVVVRKRMASLNASAMMAASYEVERQFDKCEEKMYKVSAADAEEHITPPPKKAKDIKNEVFEPKDTKPVASNVVIVQDTDVTITGVYVNSTLGSSQEAYCKMQYRVQSSVTEERLVRPTPQEPPKSYTPLNALSCMLPPDPHGIQIGTPSSSSALPPMPPECEPPYRYPPLYAQPPQHLLQPPPSIHHASSAFCPMPPQAHHDPTGYYQPAGPLINSHSHLIGGPQNLTKQPTVSPLDSESLQQSQQSSSVGEGPSHTFRYQQPPVSSQAIPQPQLQVPPVSPIPSHYSRPPHQMHCPTYPPSYYTYGQHPRDMCYSPPYQSNYYTPKVYPTAYRQYMPSTSYYQSVPPSELYEHPGSIHQSPLIPPSVSQQPTQSIPTSTAPIQPQPQQMQSPNTQLVPAIPNAPHLDHYSPYFTPGYNHGGGQCYTRSIQPPFIDSSPYQGSCPCPIQSFPKNVHIGPRIGDKGPCQKNTSHLHDSALNPIQFKTENTSKTGNLDIVVKPEIVDSHTQYDTNHKTLDSIDRSYEKIALVPQHHPNYTLNPKLLEQPEMSISPARGSIGPGIPKIQAGATQPLDVSIEKSMKNTLTQTPVTSRRARVGKNMAREMMLQSHPTNKGMEMELQGDSLNESKNNICASTPIKEQIHNEEYEKNSTTTPHFMSAKQTVNGKLIKQEDVKKECDDDVLLISDKSESDTISSDHDEQSNSIQIIDLSSDNGIKNHMNDNSEKNCLLKRRCGNESSADEIIDLDEENTITTVKRRKILEFHKNPIKKSPPNSYKSLIKPSETKTYLCRADARDKDQSIKCSTPKTEEMTIELESFRNGTCDKDNSEHTSIECSENRTDSIGKSVNAIPLTMPSIGDEFPQELSAAEEENFMSHIDSTGEGISKGYCSDNEILSRKKERLKIKLQKCEGRSRSESKKSDKISNGKETVKAEKSKPRKNSRDRSTSSNKSKERVERPPTAKRPKLDSDDTITQKSSTSTVNKKKTDTKTKKSKTSKAKKSCEKSKKLPENRTQNTDELNDDDDDDDENDDNVVENDDGALLDNESPIHNNNNNILFDKNNKMHLDALAASTFNLNKIATAKKSKSRGSKFSNKKKHRVRHLKLVEEVIIPRQTLAAPRWSNGWNWLGEPFQGKVFLNSDDHQVVRTRYPAMRHDCGDTIRPGDCVLLRAGSKKNELPYVAKVASLWENPEDGEMMMSLLWYYRPEHTEQGRLPNDCPDEVFASKHQDHNSVACIEDKCYVLTFNEYCRYRKSIRAIEQGIEEVPSIVPALKQSTGREVPLNTNSELILFCRRVYEFRLRRLIKNPS